MSLIEKMMEQCVLYNRIKTSDGYGGYKTVYQDGAEFMATIIKNSTTEAVVAEKQGIKEIFTVVIPKSFELEYHDAFRRVRDGETFLVTSMPKDSEAPEESTVRIAKVTAERWSLPSE